VSDLAKRKALDSARRAQAKCDRVKLKLDEANAERRESFKAAKDAGLSLAEIGKAAHLHRTRVDQILRGK
jgi:hypothetical protein